MCTKNLKMLLALFAIVSHSHAGESCSPTEENLPIPPKGKEWRLTFSDEFNGSSIDENRWEILGDQVRKGGWWLR